MNNTFCLFFLLSNIPHAAWMCSPGWWCLNLSLTATEVLYIGFARTLLVIFHRCCKYKEKWNLEMQVATEDKLFCLNDLILYKLQVAGGKSCALYRIASSNWAGNHERNKSTVTFNYSQLKPLLFLKFKKFGMPSPSKKKRKVEQEALKLTLFLSAGQHHHLLHVLLKPP